MPSKLQQEIKQGRPFQSSEQEAAVALLRTSDQLRRELAAVIEPQGITLQQYNVLRILRGAGESGLPTLEIAFRMIEQTPGITRLLDRLEKKHLVRRERCVEDRRQVLCWITAEGLKIVNGLDGEVDAADTFMISRLKKAEVSTLLALLEKLRG